MNIMYERVQELERLLSDLYEGRRVVVPHDIDHAHNMMMIAEQVLIFMMTNSACGPR